MSTLASPRRYALFALLLAPLPAIAQDVPPATPLAALSMCRADVQRLCDGVQPGGGRIIACMRDHLADVSPGCQDAIQKVIIARSAAPPAK
jgi:hypothetical protein